MFISNDLPGEGVISSNIKLSVYGVKEHDAKYNNVSLK